KLRFDYELDAVPLSGKIWYPDAPGPSAVLFIIHGNHDVDAESYLGYDYLGEYLASNGYALVSVDENSCNGLSAENDARAVLLLENVKQILAFNEDETSPLFGKLDTDKIALAGHSRGGEAICLAALFNDYDRYPENGNISFDYHFPITSLIAIAPVCDQYVPAGKTVRLTDVSYLLLHGLNDQDVSSVMGEKQYYNIDFSGKKDCFKSTLCLNGANHGQFNTLWGRYDYPEPTCRFLDVHDLLDADAQRRFLCAMVKTFLDVTVKGDRTYRSLFYDIESYKAALPDTAYQQVYADGTYTCRFDFDTQKDLGVGGGTNWKLSVDHCSEWTEKRRKATSDAEHGNCALAFRYGETEEKAVVTIKTGGVDLSDNLFTFDLADMREKKADLADAGAIAYHVIFTDEGGHTARIENPRKILPSVGVQLYKPDALFGQYEYKHQFTTVCVSPDDCKMDDGFDASSVDEIKIVFDDPEGDLEIDEIGIAKKSDI
ncbi:MAG: chlorophyllase, partial [Lachnospiraceae bacterium]|nr:chlorophyllase [Lachnospiraceae bacterium]